MGKESKVSVWISTLPLLESKCDLIQTSYDSHFLSLSPRLQSIAERAVSLWERSHSIQTAECISFGSSWVPFCLQHKVKGLIVYTVLLLHCLTWRCQPVRHVLSPKHTWNLKKNVSFDRGNSSELEAHLERCSLAAYWLGKLWICLQQNPKYENNVHIMVWGAEQCANSLLMSTFSLVQADRL